jgi:hypothetical protein
MGSLLTADGSTMSRVWEIMCWSLNAMWLGKWPYTNWDGNPFAEGSVDAARAGTELADGFCLYDVGHSRRLEVLWTSVETQLVYVVDAVLFLQLQHHTKLTYGLV